MCVHAVMLRICITFWPHGHCSHKSITKYINSCIAGQPNKAAHNASAGLARPLPVPDRPYAVSGLDFIIMPPNKEGKNCCVVFVCHKSKLVCTFAATATGDKSNPLSAAAVARIYFESRIHGSNVTARKL